MLWTAEVSGSELYEVTIRIAEDGTVTDTSCDCPYEFGPYCKHQAAVLYAIREVWPRLTAVSTKTPKKAAAPKADLASLLVEADKSELSSFILDYAKTDEPLKDALLLQFAPKTTLTEYAQKTVKSAISRVKRKGYVEYRDAFEATRGADKVLKMAEDLRLNGECLNTVKLCEIVLLEMIALLHFCDDSDGHVGGVIYAAMKLVTETAAAAAQQYREEEALFEAIIAHANMASSAVLTVRTRRKPTWKPIWIMIVLGRPPFNAPWKKAGWNTRFQCV